MTTRGRARRPRGVVPLAAARKWYRQLTDAMGRTSPSRCGVCGQPGQVVAATAAVTIGVAQFSVRFRHVVGDRYVSFNYRYCVDHRTAVRKDPWS